MIHHEFNTKHFFFWAWNPRSRHSTPHICSKCITFRAKLVPVTGPHLFEHNFLKAVGRTQLEGSCKEYAGKTNSENKLRAVPCRPQARREEHLKHPDRWLPSRAAFVCLSQWWSIMNSIRSTVAFEHEIPGADVLAVHICSKCITFLAELVSVTGPRLFEQNFR